MVNETYDRISAWVEENYPNGIELYAYYSDEIGPKEAQEILNAKHPAENFFDWIYEAYMDYADDEMRHTYEEMLDDLGLENDNYGESWEIFLDLCYCVYPEEHFLKQVFNCDIFIDSGDWDSEFGVNIMYPMYDTVIATSPKEIDKENVILWLAKKQGYTKTELWRYMNSPTYRKNNRNAFLDSVFQECLNTGSLNGLVFAKKFTLGELIEIKENKSDITITKDINGGLFNRWWGGGSLLEIELKKDMVVPQDEIFDICIDAAIRGTGNYGIDDVYGMCSSFWR